jgi:hypothetical protein
LKRQKAGNLRIEIEMKKLKTEKAREKFEKNKFE